LAIRLTVTLEPMMNIKPNSLHHSDVTTLLHPYTDARLHETQGPMIIERGKGIHLWDSEGKQYIDGLAGLWSVAVGYGEDRLRHAANAQMEKLAFYHIFAHKSHEPVIRLSEKLVEMTPANLTRTFFTSSGSEANDTVIKLVWYMNNAMGRPKKKKFLSRIKGYHGITIASGSLTGLPINHRDFDLPAIPVHHLTCPHHYRFGHAGENEAAFCARLIAEAEEVILREDPATIAAFIGEPLMGAGGVMPPPDGYWQGIEALCRKYDILLVADEVISGFGRLGTAFGCEKYGFTPDIMTLSKQLTSSYMPLAAVLFSEEIYAAVADNTHEIGNFGHGYTASGHPVATAVALVNIAIIEERDLIGNAARLAVPFQSGLRAFGEMRHVGEVRGAGMICGIELVADKATRRPFDAKSRVGIHAANIAAEEGLITRALGDTLALCPPLIVSADEVEQIIVRMGRTLERTHDWIARTHPA